LVRFGVKNYGKLLAVACGTIGLIGLLQVFILYFINSIFSIFVNLGIFSPIGMHFVWIPIHKNHWPWPIKNTQIDKNAEYAVLVKLN
jgi:hypothetical protein